MGKGDYQMTKNNSAVSRLKNAFLLPIEIVYCVIAFLIYMLNWKYIFKKLWEYFLVFFEFSLFILSHIFVFVFDCILKFIIVSIILISLLLLL